MRRVFRWTAGLVTAVLVGFGAVYLTVGAVDNAVAKDARHLATGHMRNFSFAPTRVTHEDATIQTPTGETKLSAFKGKTILINLWATWCPPCRHEMPYLDQLQAKLGGDAFEVVAIGLDFKGLRAITSYFERHELKNLAAYADTKSAVVKVLKAEGMPVSILIDSAGREVGRLPGIAKWDSEEAIALIQSVIDEGAGGKS